MVIAAFVFIVAFTVMLAVYWLLMVRPEQAEHSALTRRLSTTPGLSGGAAASAGWGAGGSLLREPIRLSKIPVLERLLAGVGQMVDPLQKRIARAGLRVTPGAVFLMSAVAAVCAWLAVTLVFNHRWLGLFVAPIAAWMPFAYINQRARKRLLALEEQFPDAIELISRALRAGHGFTTGLGMVSTESPEPVASEFRQLYEEQNFGRPLPEALRAFGDRISLLDARFFVTAVLTQRESGGNLAEVLDNLAGVIRDRFKVKRQVRVITAHARITGWVLICEPPVLAIALTFLAPGHITKLVSDPLGVYLVLLALVLQVVGTLVIRKLVNIEY
jgi:tight adherence protein B